MNRAGPAIGLLLLTTASLAATGCSRRGDLSGTYDLSTGWEARLEPHGAEPPDRIPQLDASGWRPAPEVDIRRCGFQEGCDVWARRQLPALSPGAGRRLVFRAYTRELVLYLEERAVYRYAGQGSARLSLHLVELPEWPPGAQLHAWLPDPPPDPLGSLVLVPADRSGDVLRAYLAEPLRTELAELLLAVMLTVVGLLGVGFGGARKDALLASFGAFSLLYGIRLFFASHLSLWLGAPVLAGALVQSCLTYLINVPAVLFMARLLDLGRRWQRPLVALVAAFALIGVGSDLVTSAPFSLARANNIFVLLVFPIWIGGWVVARRRLSRDLVVAVAGGFVFLALATAENLRGLGFLSGSLNLEPLGFFVFLSCLGWVVVRRVLEREKQLVALDSELATARRIQTAILPRQSPELEGIKVAARYRPASAVAGDYYDFLPGPDGELGIVVADVAGHGVPAALIASMVKIAFVSQAEHAGAPDRVLTEVNRALCGQMRREFVTAAYLWVDPRRRTLLAAGAGHPHPLLWRRGWPEPREIGHNGLLLGRFPRAAYEFHTLDLEPGDRLLVFTDGILEARNPNGEAFGETHLSRFVVEHRELDPEDLADSLVETLCSWVGPAGFEDDLTLVVAQIAEQAD